MPYNEWGDAVIAIDTELSANTMDLTSEFTIELVISDGTAGQLVYNYVHMHTHAHALLVPGAFKSHLYNNYTRVCSVRRSL